MNFSNMFVQISFMICCITTIRTIERFFASMNPYMLDKVVIFFKLFATRGTIIWAKFETLQYKYLIDQYLFSTILHFGSKILYKQIYYSVALL